MLGYEREDELLGRNMHWQIHQKHADGIRAPAEESPIVRAFQANEGSHVDDEVLWRADGTSFPAEYWSYPQRIDGVAVGMVVTFIDITERKQVEEKLAAALELHKQLLENAPALIWRAGTDAKCSWFNTTWLEFTGRTMEQELGDGWAEGVHAEDFDRCLKIYLDAFAARRPFHMDYRLRRPDGTYSWISDFGISLKDISGGFCGYIGYCFDITGRMQAQEEILRINRELEEATAKAEKATAAKSEFLAIMSHEMRNPLTGILGFAELLAVTPLTGEQQSCTEAMQESGAHLLSLINDVLDFSSIEKGALAIHPAPFDLAHLVKFSSDIVRKSATDKGLTIHCDVAAGVPKKITGDERRIRQILINLLANAVKFTSDGSVSLRVAGSGEFLEFSVEDTGLGISSEALARLFKLFTQGDSTINQKYGGTGIGLAVSGRLAEAMGGTISVVSDPGKGTTFTLRLPLEVPAGGMASVPSHLFIGADGASPSSPGALTPVRIDALPVLVADDDRSHSLMVGKILQSLGYRVEFAANGAEAVDAFAPGKYLAILMDLQMPVMNGFEAAAIIRSRESTSRVPIIALTGNVIASSPEAYFAAGMDDFLSKPFKKEELAAKLACVAQIEGAAEGAPACP
jgi:two-component system CheB/CheR fusion protein